MKRISAVAAFTTTMALQFIPLASLYAGSQGVTVVSENLPDGTSLRLGQTFTKIWTVESGGAVNLEQGTKLEYVSGSAGCDHTAIEVNRTVSAAEPFSFAISCTAPRLPGAYREDWAVGSGRFWVSVVVVSTDGAALTSETIPPGTTMLPGQSYTQTWTLTNTGNTTWGSGYSLNYASGNAGCAKTSIPVSQTVPPDGTITSSVSCKAPSGVGAYRADWKMVSPSGTINLVTSGTLSIQFEVANNGTLVINSAPQQTSGNVPTVSEGESVSFVATVKDSKGRLAAGAWVPVADGLNQLTGTIVAGSDGTASYTTTVPANEPAGSYAVTFGPASKGGYTDSGTSRNSVTVAAPLLCMLNGKPAPDRNENETTVSISNDGVGIDFGSFEASLNIFKLLGIEIESEFKGSKTSKTFEACCVKSQGAYVPNSETDWELEFSLSSPDIAIPGLSMTCCFIPLVGNVDIVKIGLFLSGEGSLGGEISSRVDNCEHAQVVSASITDKFTGSLSGIFQPLSPELLKASLAGTTGVSGVGSIENRTLTLAADWTGISVTGEVEMFTLAKVGFTWNAVPARPLKSVSIQIPGN